MRKLQETVELSIETARTLEGFLCSSEQKSLLRRLKEYLIIFQLRKKFSFLNIESTLANNMYFCFILVLMSLLQGSAPLSDEHENTYRKMWNYIG